MNIFEYPNALAILETQITSLRNEKDTLEKDLRDLKAKLIVEFVDIVTYKSSAVRENFIIFQLANNVKYATMEDRLLAIQAEIRLKTDEHSKLRREFRLIEPEYHAHGIREYSQCNKK